MKSRNLAKNFGDFRKFRNFYSSSETKNSGFKMTLISKIFKHRKNHIHFHIALSICYISYIIYIMYVMISECSRMFMIFNAVKLGWSRFAEIRRIKFRFNHFNCLDDLKLDFFRFFFWKFHTKNYQLNIR